jgi:hypothetical protein
MSVMDKIETIYLVAGMGVPLLVMLAAFFID